ncbi:unnamed protein product [Periconia digitata]|uniref:Uncharacterized protein n=1 Tax=Periconia digitata TaxID=1303443 RepID=A0A9W4U6I4_9PLEO|nr:unnamed protein product [Periconia digitata]
MAGQWQFIQLCTSDGRVGDAESRRKVRKNAMRQFKRNERLANREKHMHQQQLELVTTAPFRPSQEVTLEPRGIEDMLDPFSTTALPASKDAYRLLHHFVTVITPALLPFGDGRNLQTFNEVFIQSVQQDRGATASMLFHAGYHHDHLTGTKGWSRHTTEFYSESLHIVSERLNVVNKEKVGDELVCMVAFLAATGNINGPDQNALDKPHMTALQTLIGLRGGIRSLGWGGSLALIIQIADLVRATISGQRPSFPAPDITENPLTPILISPSFPTAPEPPNQDPSVPCRLNPLLSTGRNLVAYQLSLLSTTKEKNTQSIQNMTHFTELCIAFEHYVLCFCTPATNSHAYPSSGSIPYTSFISTLPPKSRTPEPHKGADISDQPHDESILFRKAATISLKICISLIFRNLTTRSNTIRRLQAQLKSLLLTMLLAVRSYAALSWEEKSILLWVLWVGGSTVISVNQADAELYVPQIQSLLGEMGLREWEEVKSVLAEVLWSERCEREGGCQDLCERVGVALP